MGAFDNLVEVIAASMTPQAALLLAAISMVAADGTVDDGELAVARRLDGSKSTSAWETALKTYRTRTVRECVNLSAGAMNGEQRRGAMANLIDIAMADGSLAGAEKALLEVFAEAFEISKSDVAKMVEVISVKNNRAVFR